MRLPVHVLPNSQALTKPYSQSGRYHKLSLIEPVSYAEFAEQVSFDLEESDCDQPDMSVVETTIH